MNSPKLKHISECFIKPKYEVKESKLPHYLTPWDLQLASTNYGQEGLLFTTKHKKQYSIYNLLNGLKHSLSLTLVHFYPVAGQLVIKLDDKRRRCLVYVDSNKGPGVKFVHASLDMTVSDILSPRYVPSVVKHLFLDKDGEINFDGDAMPLFMVQVTELIDGVFLGVSINHMIADGVAHWHLLACWSQVYRSHGKTVSLSRKPVLQRWAPEGYELENLYIPYTHNSRELITSSNNIRPLRVRHFYFSARSLQNLKAKALEENKHQYRITSFISLLALAWRSIIRARGLPPHTITHFNIPINDRTRLNPPLPNEYFGNAISIPTAIATVGELMGKGGLGYAAQMLHKTVANHSEKAVLEFFQAWSESRYPIVIQRNNLVKEGPKNIVQVGGSNQPIELFEHEFGLLGKPIATRKGNTNVVDGQMFVYPSLEGNGSVELGVWLSPDTMTALESDVEFMVFVSSSEISCRL